MPERPSLSLCMIVRDERRYLPRCLKSIEGLVDEIVVVDTGSQDGTDDLARDWGARVFYEPWKGDFSLARNASLARASGDWILVLDADEELVGGRETLSELLRAPDDVEGYLLTIESPTHEEPGSQVLVHLNLRLFRRRPEYKFTGMIHEQLLPSIVAARPEARILEAPVVIRHHGYLSANNAAKAARNRSILSQALLTDPDNAFLRYHLGVTCYQSGDYRGAVEQFWPLYHRLNPEVSFYPTLVRNLAIALLEVGDVRQALAVAERGCKQFPDYADLFYLRGVALRRLRRYREAVEVLEACCRMPEPPGRYVNTRGVNGPLAQVLLGQIEEELGDCRRAAGYYARALEKMPEHPGALSGLVRVLKFSGFQGGKLSQALEQLAPQSLAKTPCALIKALVEVGEGRVALDFIPPAQDPAWAGEERDRLHLLEARCWLQAGRWKELLRAALKVQPLGAVYREALRMAILAASLGERRQLASHLMRRLQVAGETPAVLVWRAYALYLWGAAAGPPVQLNRKDERQKEEAWWLLEKTVESGSRRHATAALGVISRLESDVDQLRLGHLYCHYGWVAEAADCYLKALEARAVDEKMCLAMGRICTARGLYKEAATFYQQAAELNPTPAYTLLLVEARLREAAALLDEGQKMFPDSARLAALKEIVDVSLECLARGDG